MLNHEQQYSIWPVKKSIPLGWENAGKEGPRADCLAYIKEVWTDIRSLRLKNIVRNNSKE